MHGNDFQSWRDATDDALVQAVARGIRSADPNHIHTAELNFLTSGSLDDPSWAPLIELDAAYTYFPTYAQVLNEYKRPDAKPVFMVEANYEFEHNPLTDDGSAQNLRRQEYWTMLSGATGQLYGSAYTWRLEKGWEANLDTPGVMQLKYMKDIFVSRKWYDLIPDQDHTVVTAGYNSFSCLLGSDPDRKSLGLGRKSAFTSLEVFRHWLHTIEHLRGDCQRRRWLLGDSVPADDPHDHCRHVKIGGSGESALVRSNERQIRRRRRLTAC